MQLDKDSFIQVNNKSKVVIFQRTEMVNKYDASMHTTIKCMDIVYMTRMKEQNRLKNDCQM